MKKSMSIVDLRAWASEAPGFISGARISNIYYTGRYWFMKIYGRERLILKLEPGRRIHLSKTEPPNKLIDKTTAVLRKHVRGGVIEGLQLVGFERIIRIDVKARGRIYRLYIEVLPRGVLALALSDNTILYASRYTEMRDRAIKPRVKYMLPPSTNLLEKSMDELVKSILEGKDLVRGVARGLRVPGEVAEEALYRAGLYEVKTVDPRKLSRRDLELVVEKLLEVIEESRGFRGYLIRRDGKPFSFTPFHPKLYAEQLMLDVTETKLFNDAVDAYFTYIERVEEEKDKEETIRGEIERIRRTIEQQQRVIDELEKRIREKEREATLLSIKADDIALSIECAKKTRKQRGWEAVVECPHVVGYDKNAGLIRIRIDDAEIPVSIRTSIWDYIKSLYRRIGELKHKLKKARDVLKELENKAQELEKEKKLLLEETHVLVRPRMWFEKYHWLITRSGFLVIGGRDASQNESIVRRYLSDNDVFMHADIHGAPVTVMKTRGRKPDSHDLADAACIAACYSKAWKAGFATVDVYWVWGSQVSKTPPSGEYLAKGSFMVYGKRNYITGVKLELALGIERVYDEIYGAYHRVCVGPRDLVESRSIVYAVIVPGDMSRENTAEKIYKEFRETTGRPLVAKEDIADRIPGKSRIIEVSRGRAYGGEEG